MSDPVVVETAAYRLEVAATGLLATLSTPGGAPLAALRPLAALDTTEVPDETLAVSPPRLEDGAIVVERRSTCWERTAVALVVGDDALEIRTTLTGSGALGEARLLAARSLVPGQPTGLLPSGSRFRRVFTPNPADPRRLVRDASESLVIGVAGDSDPGRGHWFFTPAPLSLAFSVDEEEWTTFSVVSPVDELRFVELAYVPGDGAFHFVLDYEGHTRVDGEFAAPTLLVRPGEPDPYRALRRYRDDLAARDAAPAPAEHEWPDWWLEPMFCGWGAQSHLANVEGGRAADYATAERYDAFLAHLEREQLVPGTVVIDDKWQAAYGTNHPDEAKWPDLAGWIARRHERGQRVLLWWKAWDAEGLPPELCIRNAGGAAVALDPGNPAAKELLRETMARLMSPGGLDADGLKVDFTARTPSGRALEHHGASWGIALLHELLATVYDAAKEAKPDALLVTHTVHPAFADVTDMIRLNDMIRAGDGRGPTPIVQQMRHRAEVVRAVLPELPIDTDDWCIPDLATWRDYAREKIDFGVPALYYVSHVDATGEELTRDDYATLRHTWAAWRAKAHA